MCHVSTGTERTPYKYRATRATQGPSKAKRATGGGGGASRASEGGRGAAGPAPPNGVVRCLCDLADRTFSHVLSKPYRTRGLGAVKNTFR